MLAAAGGEIKIVQDYFVEQGSSTLYNFHEAFPAGGFRIAKRVENAFFLMPRHLYGRRDSASGFNAAFFKQGFYCADLFIAYVDIAPVRLDVHLVQGAILLKKINPCPDAFQGRILDSTCKHIRCYAEFILVSHLDLLLVFSPNSLSHKEIGRPKRTTYMLPRRTRPDLSSRHN